jgi:hypothetical protein
VAFTVEDGTGVIGANSYASVETADAYFTEAGISAWQGDTSAKQLALVRATRYINQRWGDRLALPFAADYALPADLVSATCEYGLRTLGGTSLAPDPSVDENGVSVVLSRKKIGPIEREYKVLGDTTATQAFRSYPVPDSMIARLLRSSSYGSLSVIR